MTTQPDLTDLKTELFYALRELNRAVERSETIDDLRLIVGTISEFSNALRIDPSLHGSSSLNESLSMLRIANDRLARVCRARTPPR